MEQSNPFEEQIETNLSKLDALPEFAKNPLWLTFYLMGPPKNLQEVSEALNVRGWVNVDGWEGAFLYPKVQAEKSVEGIVQIAEATQELCARHDVDILNIDADTSPDEKRSRFVTLYRS